MITVTFTCRLATDPMLKTTPGGTSVCTFSIANNRPYRSQTGEKAADFFRCVAWRKTAEFIAQNFTKGKMITAVGRLESNEYKDSTGAKRTGYEIVVESAEFCDSKPKTEYHDDYEIIESEEDLPF